MRTCAIKGTGENKGRGQMKTLCSKIIVKKNTRQIFTHPETKEQKA
jgi:hypothetical protein